MADALDHAEVIVLARMALQVLRGAAQLGDRLRDVLLPRVLLAEADAARDVLGIEIDELLQRVEARLRVADFLVVRSDGLPFLGRVAGEAELLVQLREADVHLDALDDLEHLLVERDGLQVEALRRVRAGDLLEAVRGLGRALHLLVELRQLLQDADVVRIELQDPLVLLHRLLELALGYQLRGRLDDLVLVHRYGRLARGSARGKTEGQRNPVGGYIQDRRAPTKMPEEGYLQRRTRALRV